MHYKNGRIAKVGDKVVNLTGGLIGILHSVNSDSQTCNGRLAPTSQSDAYVTIEECLLLDDIAAAELAPPNLPKAE